MIEKCFKGLNIAMLAAVCCMAVSIVMVSCRQGGKTEGSLVGDSIYNVNNIRKVMGTNPSQALNMLDTAENRKLMTQCDIYGLKSIIYHNVFGQSSVALKYMLRAYECPECAKDTTLLLKTLKGLGGLNYTMGHYSEALDFMKKGMEVARKVGDVCAEAFFITNMGLVKSEIGTVDEALENFDRSISLLKNTGLWKTDYFVADDILMACMSKINILVPDKRYAEAKAAIPECQAAFEALAKCGNLPDGLLDSRLAEFSSLRGLIYHGLDDMENAEKYFDMMMHTEYAKTSSGATVVVPYLMLMGKYKDAISNLKEQERVYENSKDTVSDRFVDGVLYNQMVAYHKLGQYKNASSVGIRMKALADSLKEQERSGKLLEMVTAYETETKEAMLRENALKMSRLRLFVYAVVLVCVLLVVVMGGVLYFNWRIRRRNMATVKTIEELMEKKDELLDFRINNVEDVEEAKNTVRNLKEYISEVHMRNAVKMLKSDTSHTIAEIATDCGFASVDEFCHYFENKYGISPIDYRKWSNRLREKEQHGMDNEEFKRNLLRNISHEIRTPLNQISGFVQLLTNPEIDIEQSEKKRFNDIIMTQANHMALMVNDFVEITEYESGKSPLVGEDITMRELMEKITLSAGEPQNGVQMNVGKLTDPLRILNINVKAVVRMAQCLVDNAIKFTTNGYIYIDLVADDATGMLRLTVADTGKGVASNKAERIFERFYKEDEFVPGIGLGLPLVRIIATRMGGTAYLDPTYSYPGARFVVEIPLK